MDKGTDCTPCPFCGQMVMCDEGLSEGEKKRVAAEKCDCLDARKHRDERMYLLDAEMRFDTLLSQRLGGEQESETISPTAADKIKRLFSEMPLEILSLTLKLASGDNLTVKRGGTGEKFKFSRSRTDKIEN